MARFEAAYKKKPLNQRKIYNSLHILRNDGIYMTGEKVIHEIIRFCLVVVADEFPFTTLQIELLADILPTLLPCIFGEHYYSNNRKKLESSLGVAHEYLHHHFIGSRRDGKSIVVCCVIAALCCAAHPNMTIYLKDIPLCGPTEGNGITFLQILARIFTVTKVKPEYPYITFQHSEKRGHVYNSKNNTEFTLAPLINTDGAARGKTFYVNFFDEFRFIDKTKWEKLHMARFKQRIMSVCITTPNPKDEYWNMYNTTSGIIHVDYRGRICPRCIAKHEDGRPKYIDLKDAQLMCQQKGHREPPCGIWLTDQKSQNAWSVYMSKSTHSVEFFGVDVSRDGAVFNKTIINKFFNEARNALLEMHRIDITIDPAEHGNSDYAIAFFHTYGENTQLLSANAFKFPPTSHTAEQFVIQIHETLNKMKPIYNVSVPVYIWVESPGHYAPMIAKLLAGNGNMKVMCGLSPDKHIKDKVLQPGIFKSKELTELYVSSFRDAVNLNRLKLAENFFTINDDGDRFMLDKLREQLLRFTRLPNGKLTGKGPTGSENDDLAVVVLMGKALINLSNIKESDYNKQLFSNQSIFS